jgi:hypothetical protein
MKQAAQISRQHQPRRRVESNKRPVCTYRVFCKCEHVHKTFQVSMPFGPLSPDDFTGRTICVEKTSGDRKRSTHNAVNRSASLSLRKLLSSSERPPSPPARSSDNSMPSSSWCRSRDAIRRVSDGVETERCESEMSVVNSQNRLSGIKPGSE